jgi:serine protease inhibitor
MALGVVVAFGVVAAGCGSTAGDANLPVPMKAEGVARVTPSSDAPVAAVVNGMVAFGYQLGRIDPASTGNWVVSPASIAYAFAMARAGAGGRTASEIDKVFGFPDPGVHEAFNAITRQVVTADVPPKSQARATRRADEPPKPPVVCLGNALFPQSGYPIGDAFLTTLAQQYGAGVYPVDYARSSAKEAIDAWVRQQTAQRIQKAFDQLDADTRLVLANTVYLKADWEQAFGRSPTTTQAFRLATGSTAQVPMMHLVGNLRYAQGPGWQAVQLPYAAGDLAMWVLLPAGTAGTGAGMTPHDLLSPASIGAVAAAMHPTTVDLSLPRWDFATDLDLTQLLPKLGITEAFTDRADFSGIHEGLFIDQAVHRANITVDEWGTEAAALTALSFKATAAPGTPSATMTADHPFAFAIVHTPTGVPLFMGHVADPSTHT